MSSSTDSPVGASGAGKARAIVLVHAFGSSSRAWAPQMATLGERYRMIAPDLPGHGGAPGPFTLDRAVATVRAAIPDGGAHVVGISGGATVALVTCLEHPAAVRSLALSAGVARAPRWFVLQRAMARAMPEALLARMLAGTYSGSDPARRPAAAEDFRRAGKATFRSGLRELAGIDLRGRLREVQVPTLVLCGEQDRANVPLSRQLAAGIAGAQLRIVPGATHLWNLQQPQVFDATIAEFVERAEATS